MSTGNSNQGAFKNIGFTSIAKVLTYVSSAVSSIVLGRCLLASDYGVVSFAFIFVNFLERFADIGIGSALVQRKELDETTLYTAFTLKFIFGVAVTVVTFGLSALLPYFMDNHDVVAVLKLLSLCFLFNNISFVPNSLLTREMNFKKISIAETTVYFSYSIIAIALAVSGYGYWSVVVANLFSNFLSAVLLTLFRPVAVKFRLDRVIARELARFGGYLFISGLFTFCIFNLDNFIIGAVKGAKELGYYALAFNWGSMICLIMYSVVLRVIFPFMAKLQDHVAEIRKTYLKTLEYSSYIIVLANISLFVISKEFLISVLGHGSDKWLPALTSLRILCFYGIVRGLLEPVGQVIAAIGKTKVIFKANLTASVIEIGAIYPALTHYGLVGVSCVVTFAYFSQYFIYYFYLKHNFQILLIDLINAVKPSFIAAIPLLCMHFLFSEFLSTTFIYLLLKLISALLIYVFVIGLVTNWELFIIIRNQISRYKSATVSP